MTSCCGGRSRSLAAAVILAAVLGGACRPSEPATGASPQAQATDVTPVTLDTYDFGGDFALTDQAGRPFSLGQGRGRVRLLFFGFTHCPDVCPLTLSRIARALEALDPHERAEVETLFATVDVDRDTPAALGRYLSGVPVPVVGLSGTRAEVDAVVAQYKASYEITPSDSAGGPTVSHSTYLYLIDRENRVRHLFRMSDSPERITAGIRLALRSPRAAEPAAR